jgi:hypothetical protein
MLMTPDISEVVQDRRFCIFVVLLIFTIFAIYIATTIYNMYFTWLAAVETGLPITMDFDVIRDWIILVIGFPVMIVFFIGLYLYFLVQFIRISRD